MRREPGKMQRDRLFFSEASENQESLQESGSDRVLRDGFNDFLLTGAIRMQLIFQGECYNKLYLLLCYHRFNMSFCIDFGI